MKTAEQLYIDLKAQIAEGCWDDVTVCEDGTTRVDFLYGSWWKLKYILDDVNRRAYEIIDSARRFEFVSENDIDWATLQNIPESAMEKAKTFSAVYPFNIGRFENGVAEVSWQLIPDGYYYMDDDGYGMTDDEEITLYGFVDREMNVITKFQYIGKDWSRLKEIRNRTYARLHTLDKSGCASE